MARLNKWLVAIVIVSLVLPTVRVSAGYNQNGAQAYLAAHGGNPWSVMALAALGQTPSSTAFLTSVNGDDAVDYEAPILAITALGQNPRTFGSSDYVAALKSYHNNGQIGDAETINDDIFGILALVAAGEPVSDPAIVDSKNFIINHQNNNGGWGFAVTSDPDTNITASAILALLAAGVDKTDSRIQSAVSYLHTSQNSDGGFPYSPNSASDSASTSWVVWALNALDVNQASWNKSNNTPHSYLESNQSDQGYFKFQSNSGEDGFTPTTTSYAVIALQGESLPIRIVANDAPRQKYPFRIEGSEKTVCAGETVGPTALDIVKNAKELCGFTYEIKETNFGPYLSRILNDEASGMTGWMYLVNNISPDVGAADYELQANDTVLWYFGGFGWIPTRLSLSAGQIAGNQSVTVTVESFGNNSWSPLSGATVYYGADTATTGDDGKAIISPKDGFYKIYAQKEGYVRSDNSLLQVGFPSSSTVNLSVNISQAVKKPDESVSFTVTPDTLDFGTLNPGASSTKDIAINNTGSTDIRVEAIVSGDSVFAQNLELNNVTWGNFKTEIAKNDSQTVSAKLSIPADYSEDGAKSGQLTVWAMAD